MALYKCCILLFIYYYCLESRSMVLGRAQFSAHSVLSNRCSVFPAGARVAIFPVRLLFASKDRPSTYLATFVKCSLFVSLGYLWQSMSSNVLLFLHSIRLPCVS